jgi:O-antigen ligase
VNDPLVNTYLSGMVTAGLVAAGVYFMRFWSRSRDTLFLAFTGAFWVLALSEALVALGREPSGGQSWYYLLRVPAFLLIAAAIVQKNASGDDDDE